MARMSIDDMIARDTRVDRLAKLCGWSRRETRACLEDVWALCYDRVIPYLPVEDIEVTAARDAISPPPSGGFAAALRLVGLARDATAADRHHIRKDGTKVPWPDQNWRDRVYLAGSAERLGYLLTKRSAGSEGGVKSGQSRRSKTKHSFDSASSESQARGNPPDPVPDLPPDPVPDLKIPNPPPARAIPPAPEPTPSPPAPQPGGDAHPTLQQLWSELELARQRAADARGVAIQPLVAHDVGRHDLAELLVEATRVGKRAELAAQIRHAIAVAELEASIVPEPGERDQLQFLSGAIFSARNFRRLVAAPAPKKRADPRPARPRNHDPPPEAIPRDQLAGPEQFAEARALLAAVTSNDDDTPDDKQHRRRKAAT